MVRVALPAVPPTRPVNALANWTPSDRAEREPGRHRAEHGHGLGELGQLGRRRRSAAPSPRSPPRRCCPSRRRRRAGRRGGRRRWRSPAAMHDGAGGEAVQLGQLRRLDAGQLGALVAEAGLRSALALVTWRLAALVRAVGSRKAEQVDELVVRRSARWAAPSARSSPTSSAVVASSCTRSSRRRASEADVTRVLEADETGRAVAVEHDVAQPRGCRGRCARRAAGAGSSTRRRGRRR